MPSTGRDVYESTGGGVDCAVFFCTFAYSTKKGKQINPVAEHPMIVMLLGGEALALAGTSDSRGKWGAAANKAGEFFTIKTNPSYGLYRDTHFDLTAVYRGKSSDFADARERKGWKRLDLGIFLKVNMLINRRLSLGGAKYINAVFMPGERGLVSEDDLEDAIQSVEDIHGIKR